jgi:hypothetical protein
MAKQYTDEELAIKRANAALRGRIKMLFADNSVVKEDEQEALKESWDYHAPSFNLDELATMNPQAASLAAMRRDTIKEVINWLTRI